MKNLSCFILGAALIFAPVAAASPREDAEYIAGALQTDEVMAVQIDSVADLMLPFFKQTFQDQGLELSSSSAVLFNDMFMEEFGVIFRREMRAVYTKVYLSNLNETELADLRAFLETESGSVFAQKQARILTSVGTLGKDVASKAAGGMTINLLARLDGPEGNAFSEEELTGLKAALK